ncbi:MAG: ABC transporter permease [Jannaschia helgolandensis]|uniref:Spermidine/putrescine transport system permease protein n=1 Tax=Jannaschia helgolandensis TaxID=188906 RepID=A0A1H7P1B9_9RHOB|nr:ABC transporter permease [Jannaschia helgolandensis]SEL29098.1 spermidine/putrescine transport system permease protein [Jannaschia helgolandensis]|tara:strand:+ start:1024 stop:1821 length:798 start_codon:yes stop_codon:yes gene_type:complete
MLRFYVFAFLLFLYAPILLLPVFAFNSGTVIAFPLDGFTLDWFAELWTNAELHRALGNSLMVAGASSVLSVLLGLAAARANVRYRFPGKAAALGLVMLPLVLPEIIVATSLLVVVVRFFGWSLSLWTVVAAHVLISTPFAIAILNASFQALDPALEEAAIDLGETRASTFRLITLPLIMPGIVAALLICFTISLDEFIIAFFLTGSDTTLPVYIWSLLRFPKLLPVIMALGTILVLVSVLILTLAEWNRRRGIARMGGKDTGGFL